MKSDLLLDFVMTAFIANIKTKDFCEVFRGNGDKISYSFKGPLGVPYYIIINGQYWDLTFVNSQQTLVFNDSKKSYDTPLFTGDYTSAACLVSEENQRYKCHPFLFKFTDESNGLLVKGFINGYNFENNVIRPLKDYQKGDEFTVKGLKGKPYIMFQYDPQWTGKQVFFIEKSGDKYDVKTYDFSFNGKAITAQEIELKWKMPAIKEIPSSRTHDLIAVMPQWVEDDSKHGLVFLFNKDIKLQYCWSRLDSFSNCQKLKELIDCSKTPAPTTITTPIGTSSAITTPTTTTASTTTEEEGSGSPIWLVPVIMILIVVVIAIIVGIAIYFMTANKSEENAAGGSTGGSGVVSQLGDKRSSDVKSKAPKPSQAPAAQSTAGSVKK